METENIYVRLWQQLRAGQASVLVRLMASVCAGLALAAAAVVAGWTYAHFGQRGYMRDEDVILPMFGAGIAWCLTLLWVWRVGRRGQQVVRPVVITIALAITTILGGAAIDSSRVRDEEALILALVLLAGALTVVIWLPVAHRMQFGRPLVDDEQRVNVNCPDCGYSLVGLRDLRCPECGKEFTIDELIGAQDYDQLRTRHAVRMPMRHVAPPESDEGNRSKLSG